MGKTVITHSCSNNPHVNSLHSTASSISTYSHSSHAFSIAFDKSSDFLTFVIQKLDPHSFGFTNNGNHNSDIISFSL
jgi:hypothetical protein